MQSKKLKPGSSLAPNIEDGQRGNHSTEKRPSSKYTKKNLKKKECKVHCPVPGNITDIPGSSYNIVLLTMLLSQESSSLKEETSIESFRIGWGCGVFPAKPKALL